MRYKFYWFYLLYLCCSLGYSKEILLLTDIHFSPFAKCQTQTRQPCTTLAQLIQTPIESWPALLDQAALNSYKEETNNALFQTGINNLTNIASESSIDTIFVTGDLLSHNFDQMYKSYAPKEYASQKYYTEFTSKSTLYVLNQIHNKFPNSKLYFVLGNNDGDNGDYVMPSKEYLKNVSQYLSGFVSNSIEFKADFGQYGYFFTSLNSQTNIIGLNMDILSTYYPESGLAIQQLKWLQAKLELSAKAKQNVIILQHIPFGADTYKSATKGEYIPVLDTKLQQSYLTLLDQYSYLIKAIYAGHFHGENLSVINGKTPLIGSLAFNAGFGNHPGFKIISIKDDGSFQGYTTYYTTLSTGQVEWKKLYSFSEVFGKGSQISKVIESFPKNISESKVIIYRQNYNGNNSQFKQPISKDDKWKYYHCNILYSDPQKYQACINN